MPLPINVWQNSPQFMDFITRNPDSFFARIFERRYGPLNNTNMVGGSNNAPGTPVAPPVSGERFPIFRDAIRGPGGGREPNTFVTGSNNATGPLMSTPSVNPWAGRGGMDPVQSVPTTGNNAATSMFPGSQEGRSDQRDPRGFPRTIPSFAAGGMMSQGGQAIRPGMPMMQDGPQLGADSPPKLSGQQLQQEAQNFARSNPQVAQQVQAAVVESLQSGELTYDELNLAVQLAKTALANPAAYPQIRQFAIQNGLGTEEEIPAQYDQGVLLILLVIGQALQGAGGAPPQTGGNALTGQTSAIAPQVKGMLPEYDDGGMTGDRQHLAVLHPREFVIPEDALTFHGTKTFHRMIQQAREPTGA